MAKNFTREKCGENNKCEHEQNEKTESRHASSSTGKNNEENAFPKKSDVEDEVIVPVVDNRRTCVITESGGLFMGTQGSLRKLNICGAVSEDSEQGLVEGLLVSHKFDRDDAVLIANSGEQNIKIDKGTIVANYEFPLHNAYNAQLANEALDFETSPMAAIDDHWGTANENANRYVEGYNNLVATVQALRATHIERHRITIQEIRGARQELLEQKEELTSRGFHQVSQEAEEKTKAREEASKRELAMRIQAENEQIKKEIAEFRKRHREDVRASNEESFQWLRKYDPDDGHDEIVARQAIVEDFDLDRLEKGPQQALMLNPEMIMSLHPKQTLEYLATVEEMAKQNGTTKQEVLQKLEKLNAEVEEKFKDSYAKHKATSQQVNVEGTRAPFHPLGFWSEIDQELWDKQAEPVIQACDHLNTEQRDSIRSLIREFMDVFRETNVYQPLNGIQVPLELKDPSIEPIKARGGRTRQEHLRAVFDHFTKLLKAGVVKHSKSPWNAPLVVAKKKDHKTGLWTKLRFCVNYRQLNDCLADDGYQFDRSDDVLHAAGVCKFLSAFDASQGFHQCKLSEAFQAATAFFCPGIGHLEYVTMPFGLKTAPAVFCRAMESMLRGLKGRFATVLMDDFLIYSKTFEEHLKHMRVFLQRCRDMNLTLSLEKAQILTNSITYNGHVIGRDGNRKDDQKTACISAWPTPRNRSEVRSFLGVAGYYRAFVEAFGLIAKPLTADSNATLDREPFEWTPEKEEAFDKLKRALKEDVVLARPDESKPFILATDWCKRGIGAVLSQIQDGKERPIAFISKALTDAQSHLDATEGEALAVVWAVDAFQKYLYGRKFTLYTDHSALRQLLKDQGHKSAKLSRWTHRLLAFDFEVKHRAGKLNTVPDVLSRLGEIEYDRNKKLEEVAEIDISVQSLTRLGEEQRFRESQDASSADISTGINQVEIDDTMSEFANARTFFARQIKLEAAVIEECIINEEYLDADLSFERVVNMQHTQLAEDVPTPPSAGQLTVTVEQVLTKKEAEQLRHTSISAMEIGNDWNGAAEDVAGQDLVEFRLAPGPIDVSDSHRIAPNEIYGTEVDYLAMMKQLNDKHPKERLKELRRLYLRLTLPDYDEYVSKMSEDEHGHYLWRSIYTTLDSDDAESLLTELYLKQLTFSSGQRLKQIKLFIEDQLKSKEPSFKRRFVQNLVAKKKEVEQTGDATISSAVRPRRGEVFHTARENEISYVRAIMGYAEDQAGQRTGERSMKHIYLLLESLNNFHMKDGNLRRRYLDDPQLELQLRNRVKIAAKMRQNNLTMVVMTLVPGAIAETIMMQCQQQVPWWSYGRAMREAGYRNLHVVEISSPGELISGGDLVLIWSTKRFSEQHAKLGKIIPSLQGKSKTRVLYAVASQLRDVTDRVQVAIEGTRVTRSGGIYQPSLPAMEREQRKTMKKQAAILVEEKRRERQASAELKQGAKKERQQKQQQEKQARILRQLEERTRKERLRAEQVRQRAERAQRELSKKIPVPTSNDNGQSKKEESVPELVEMTNEQLEILQKNDPKMKRIYEYALRHADANGNYFPKREDHADVTAEELVRQVGALDAGAIRRNKYGMRRFVLKHYQSGFDVLGHREQTVVPDLLKDPIMYEYHSSMMGGHVGRHRSILRVTDHYWWRNVAEDVSRYVASCRHCNAARGHEHKNLGVQFGSYPHGIFSTVYVDAHGPFPPSRYMGYQYVIVLRCGLTQWPELVFCRELNKYETAHAVFHQVISKFGTPLKFVCDNGKENIAKYVQAFLTILGLEKRFVAVANARANGYAENVDVALRHATKALTEKGMHDLWTWGYLVGLWALRVTKGPNMQSPAMLVLGYEPLEPFEAAIRPRIPPNGEEDSEKSKLWANDWVNQHEARVLRELTQQYKRSQMDRRNDVTNAGRVPSTFKTGDLVLRKVYIQSNKKKGFCEKLGIKFVGPSRVDHHASPDTLILQAVKVNERNGEPLADDKTKKLVKVHARSCIPYRASVMDNRNDESRTITLSREAAKEEIIYGKSYKELTKHDESNPHFQALQAVKKAFKDEGQHVLYRRGTHRATLGNREVQSIEIGKYCYAFLDPIHDIVRVVLQRVAFLQLDDSQQFHQKILNSSQAATKAIQQRTKLIVKPIWDNDDGTHHAKQFKAVNRDRVPNVVTIHEADIVTKVPFTPEKIEMQDPVVKKLIAQGDVDAKTMDTSLYKVPDDVWTSVREDPHVAQWIKDTMLYSDPEMSRHTRSRTQMHNSRAEENRKNLESVEQGGAEKGRLKREAKDMSRSIKKRDNDSTIITFPPGTSHI